jgi:hypothetical protein
LEKDACSAILPPEGIAKFFFGNDQILIADGAAVIKIDGA